MQPCKSRGLAKRLGGALPAPLNMDQMFRSASLLFPHRKALSFTRFFVCKTPLIK
jgi:hypothetical protein